MISLGTPNVVITENIELKVVEHFYKYKPKIFQKKFGLQNPEIRIKRFAAKDLYSIYWSYFWNYRYRREVMTEGQYVVTSTINNKIIIKKSLKEGNKDYDYSFGKVLIHHSEINDSFANFKYLYNLMQGDPGTFLKSKNGFNYLSHLFSYTMFLYHEQLQKNYQITTNDLVEMNYIKEIFFRRKHPASFVKEEKTDDLEVTVNRDQLNTKIKYGKFYIKFHKLNQNMHSDNIATIYWKPLSKRNIFIADFNFNNDSYVKVGNKKYKVNFLKSKTLENDQTYMSREAIIKVGELKISDFSNYDFTKNKVSKGPGEFSNKGILIPYDFKGDYMYNLHLSINKVFENMNFYVHQDIKQKLLDSYEGKIKLIIKEDNVEFEFNQGESITLKDEIFKMILELKENSNPISLLRLAVKKDDEI